MEEKKSNAPRWVRRATAATAAAAVGATGAFMIAGSGPATVAEGPQAPASIEISNVAYQQALLRAVDPAVKPKVSVVATGGTLAGKARTGGRAAYSSYAAGTYPIADLVGHLKPEIDAHADVTTVQFGNKGSGGYTIPEFHDLTLAVERELETADAVVVTTGTDTMEEFAYWLDLTVKSKKPVIITGAMRPWAAGATATDDMVLGSDGPANLFNAIKLAAGQQTYCFGTVLMLNDEIHSAREVTKANTTRMDTFESPATGPLGYVDQNAHVLTNAPARVHSCDSADWFTPFDVSEVSRTDYPAVEIAYNFQGASGSQIQGFVDAGAQGIVTMGTGAGGVSSGLSGARSSAIRDKGVWFVTTSRTGTGTTSRSTTSNGQIAGGDLQGVKARLLLMLSRAFTTEISDARTWFAEIGNATNVHNGQ